MGRRKIKIETKTNLESMDDLTKEEVKSEPLIVEEQEVIVEMETKTTSPLMVYMLFLGEDDKEYYTYTTPKITYDSNIIVENLFVKESFTEIVIEQEISEFYPSEPEMKQREIDLVEGVVIRAYFADSLDWLNNTKETAIKNVQQKSLELYKSLMPKLLERLSNVEKKERVEEKFVKSNKNNNTEQLLDL